MAHPSKKIKESKRSSKAGVYSFPEDLGQHQIIFMFRKYSYTNPGTRKLIEGPTTNSQAQIKDTIALPIPSNIADSYSIRLSRPEIGLVAENMASMASEIGGFGGNLQSVYDRLSGLGISKEDAEAMVKGDMGGISSNARYLARNNLPSFVATGLDIGTGYAVNPKLALSFEGVDLKSHSFDWNFMVRSPKESDTLRDIQDSIKRNIHPTYSHMGLIQRAMISYPSVVDIYFSGLDGSYFVKFKTCMVQAFSLNFTPSGLAILEGGKPAAAQMSLQLVETDIHTSTDYGGDHEHQYDSRHERINEELAASDAKQIESVAPTNEPTET